jgi:hypothetical protein
MSDITHEAALPSSTIEEWDDGNGNSTRFAHVEVDELRQFARGGNKSGVRQAVDYLTEQTGIRPPSDDHVGSKPIIMVGAPGKAQLYDLRRPRKWYGFSQTQPGQYAAVRQEPLSKDAQVVFEPGDVAYIGWTSGEIPEESNPDLPAQELFRNLTAAVEQQRGRRNGLLGRLGIFGK